MSTGAKPKISSPTEKKRKSSVPTCMPKQRKSLESLKANFKKQLSLPDDKAVIYDPMAKATDSFSKCRGETGICYGLESHNHYCIWDENYPENPERLKCVLKRCEDLKLFDSTVKIPERKATQEEIKLLHKDSIIDILASLEEADEEKLKNISQQYDSIYINNNTYNATLESAGCVLELTKAVIEGRIQNGMALVRPPGHHAMENEYNGYCFFNNIALAAKHAVDVWNMNRVLIVDWDVHHGQGTQQFFYKDNRVLYFSIHRYEHGDFWPNLREGEFDYIGDGEGRGYNFNVPLNKVGMNNDDYLLILHQLLLPVAYEFNPDLILIAAGYDAAIGCQEGLMKLTPAFYSHMTQSLCGLAEGKVAVVLEGGYFNDSLAEGAALTLRALKGETCPRLVDPISEPCFSIKQTVFNVIESHKAYWKSLCHYNEYYKCKTIRPHPSLKYPPRTSDSVFELMGFYPVASKEEREKYSAEIKRLVDATDLSSPPNRVCLVYDKIMGKHFNENDRDYPEQPMRISEIMKLMDETNLLKRLTILESRSAKLSDLEKIHSFDWIASLLELKTMKENDRRNFENLYNSVYFNEYSTIAALTAAGCLLQVVDSVCNGESRSGVAVIRPPGHHAEISKPNGFCLINNVAVAADYAIRKYNTQKILILDWDVHHGNGIQNIFEKNPNVLYISIHVYMNQSFFPYSSIADSDHVGKGPGTGFNVNIPWNKRRMGDGDYLAAFFRVVLPIAYEFDPDLVLVSAGFDAAISDPLGGCRVTPEGFGHMTHLLTTLASGKVILALEGGYNLMTTSYSMTVCTKALLGDPLPTIEKNYPSKEAVTTINEVINIHNKYWSRLYKHDPHLALKPDEVSSQSSESEYKTPPEVTPYSTPLHKPSQKHTYKDEPEFNNSIQGSNIDNISSIMESLTINNTSKNNEESQYLLKGVTDSSESLELSCSNSVVNKSKENIRPEIISDNTFTVLNMMPSNSANQQVSLKLSMDSGEVDPSIGAVGGTSGQIDHGIGAVGGTDEETALVIQQLLSEEMFAVVPIPWCPHLECLSAIPENGLDAKAPCERCRDPSENWICLICHEVYCSRFVNGHMLQHKRSTDHALVLSYSDMSVWCYECESYLDNEMLKEVLKSARKSKFD